MHLYFEVIENRQPHNFCIPINYLYTFHVFMSICAVSSMTLTSLKSRVDRGSNLVLHDVYSETRRKPKYTIVIAKPKMSKTPLDVFFSKMKIPPNKFQLIIISFLYNSMENHFKTFHKTQTNYHCKIHQCILSNMLI